MKKSIIYLLLLTMVFAGIVVIGGTNKEASADAQTWNAGIICPLPALATSSMTTWCIVTNGSSDNSTIGFKVLGWLGKTSADTAPAEKTITLVNAAHTRETIVLHFNGKAVYNGMSTTGTLVVASTDMVGLPSTGNGFYAAQLRIKGYADGFSPLEATSEVTTKNTQVACFQTDPAGAKRGLIVTCYTEP